MSENVVIPNFGELLATEIARLPPETVPCLLARLERTAGQRYRDWAIEFERDKDGLLACADREDDIANKVDALFEISEEQKRIVDEVAPIAIEIFLGVYAGLSAIQQITIQANAERQGASAWRGLVDAYPQFAEDLELLAKTEEANADFLDGFLAKD